jgi:hypothetical protein
MEEMKPRRVRRLDSIRLDVDDRTYFTDEGYLVDHPILTSCGIFEYTNPDGSIRRELRLPEHVFAQTSLKTYKGKPIIITHDAGVVSKNNVDREQIGTILSDGYQDGDDVRAEIIIHDTNAMKECGLKELSLGYNLDLVEEPGIWEGEPYDAIQTNIVINHLALVASARAGDQARLNIDSSESAELKGKKATVQFGKCTTDSEHPSPKESGFDDIKKIGGKETMQAEQKSHVDSMDMTPEELVEAIKLYKASKAGTEGTTQEGDSGQENTNPVTVAKPAALTEPPAKEETVNKDSSIQNLITMIEQLVSEIKTNSTDGKKCGNSNDDDTVASQDSDAGSQDNESSENSDGSENESKSLNADSVDEVFRQRLGICRIGDKLNMDGLENKSVIDGKKAIIAKVLPGLRLDGKNAVYVDAAFDLAVCEIQKRKDVDFQRRQMQGSQANRNDSGENESMAHSARQRMIDREGGND